MGTVVRDSMVACNMPGQESLSWCEGQLGTFFSVKMWTLQTLVVSKGGLRVRVCHLKMWTLQTFVVFKMQTLQTFVISKGRLRVRVCSLKMWTLQTFGQCKTPPWHTISPWHKLIFQVQILLYIYQTLYRFSTCMYLHVCKIWSGLVHSVAQNCEIEEENGPNWVDAWSHNWNFVSIKQRSGPKFAH